VPEVRITSDVAAIAQAASAIAIKVLDTVERKRETASASARDEYDRMELQMYWDWRALLQALGIVGEPREWPPAA